MKLDETLTRFLNEIQLEIQNEFGVLLSIQQIHEVVETQFEATKLGIAKGITVHWIRFGKFVFTNKYKETKDIDRLEARLEYNEDLLPHERIEIKKNAIIERANKKKEKIKEDSLRLAKPISINKLMDTPNMYKVQLPTFVALNNKHNKS